ncbi:RNA 2',3'-cyclic phosphodiesterase [Haloprofundus sp. MHR1]|uniref:RNA 2',3'-cyclic phosphodiesterase n=1 Tax=Haloprofundus sp. MHR1 TaxID=2572921 RepID=UPI0010BEE402|nr:RNA 2',3'-cyclic phosphodiesterase [Haloprofundus sp. MHR1]QCJ46915.1 RNA 2',3'-cyclic phosphodiesterase [Haloprofundus sp. MHR1]
MRLFVSIDLPRSLADAVAAVQDDLRDAEGLRFVDPTRAHLTLKFLGETDENRLEEVGEALESAVDAADVDPFEATVGGLGVFPSLDYITVVWLGLEAGGERTTRLAEAVERETTAIGFEPESREFTPHVTLARMDDARGKDVVRRVVRGTEPTVGTFRVEKLRLKQSVLGPDGPEYSTVRQFAL